MIEFRCGNPNGMELENDEDLLIMFELYEGREDIPVYVIARHGFLARIVPGDEEMVELNPFRPTFDIVPFVDRVEGGIGVESGVVNDGYEPNVGEGCSRVEPNVEKGSFRDESNRNKEQNRDESNVGGQGCTTDETNVGDELVRNEGESSGKEPYSEGVDDDRPLYSDEEYAWTDDDDEMWLPNTNQETDSSDEEVELEDEEENATPNLNVEESDSECFSDLLSDVSGELEESEPEDDGNKRQSQKKPEKDILKAYKAKSFKLTEEGKIEFEEGHVFPDVYAFRKVLRDYACEGGYKLNRIRNDKPRVTAECTNENCSWRIHASVLPDKKTFMVKKIRNKHTCRRAGPNKNATPDWISRKVEDVLRADPNVSYDVIRALLVNKWGVEPKDWQMYRAKAQTRLRIEGQHYQSYGRLPKYAELLMRLNPGTVVKISYEDQVDGQEPRVFKRIFVCFNACRIGFLKGCRPFFGLDGCFLKGPFGGCLLSAVSIDGDNGIFPIAYAIVEAECKQSWLWFLDILRDVIGDGTIDNKAYTIMSDRQNVRWITLPCKHYLFSIIDIWLAFRRDLWMLFQQSFRVHITGSARDTCTII